MNDDIGIARGISRENIETTLMGLDDAAGNGQAKTHAGVSCGEKRLGRATGGLGSETAAGIAHLNDQFRAAIRGRRSVDGHGEARITVRRLQTIEENFLEGVRETDAVATQDHR
jgi:hypothetical protein